MGWGLKLGLGLDRTLVSDPGEIVDLVSCYAIANGAKEKNAISFDELMEMN